MRSYVRHIVCLAILAMAVGVYYRDLLTGQGVLFHGDYAAQDVPHRAYVAEAFRGGELPLWAPESSCGWPLYAEGQTGVFYPLNWLFVLGPIVPLFHWSMVIHVFLCGAGTYFLALTFKIGSFGALLAGLCLSFNPLFNIEEGCANFVCSAAWMPVVAALFKTALDRRTWGWLVLSAAAFALQLLAGHPYPTWYTLLLVLCMTLFFHGTEGGVGERLRFVSSRLAVWGLIAFGLAAIQILPMAQLVLQSARAEGIGDQFIETGLKALSYRSALSPNYFGNETQNTIFAPQLLYQKMFMGVIPLLLAPIGLLGRTHRTAIMLAVLFLFGALASLEGEGTLLPILLARIPPASMFRHRASYIMLSFLAAALLSGRGLQYVINPRAKTQDQAGTRPTGTERARWWSCGFWVLAGAAAIGFHLAVRESFLPPPEFIPSDAEVAGFKLALVAEMRSRDVVALASAMGVACLLMAAGAMRIISGRILGAGLLAVQILHVVFFGLPRSALIEPDFYRIKPEVLEAMKQDDEPFRTHTVWANTRADNAGHFRSNDRDTESFRLNADMLAYNLGLLHGTEFVSAFPGPLRLQRFVKLQAASARGNPFLLGLMNVKYVLALPEFSMSVPGMSRVWCKKVCVYRNEHCLPRAFVVHRIISASDEADAWTRVSSAAFSGRTEAVVEDYDGEPLVSSSALKPSRARLVRHERNRVEIDVDCAEEGLLVLLDSYYPGWTAAVDGRPSKIYRADYAFRGVRVPAGRHRVSFRFVSRPFEIGRGITLATLLVLLACSLAGIRKRRISPQMNP